jgi:membrane protease YdiL (CAAX protease family)
MAIHDLLYWIDLVLVSVGGAALAVLLVRWQRRGCGDPLRGVPLRLHSLTPVDVSACLALNFLAFFAGAELGKKISPDNLDPQSIQVWSSVFAAAFAQSLVIGICLLAAHLRFRAGLRGLGLGRRPLGADLHDGAIAWAAWLYAGGLILAATDWLIRLTGFEPTEHSVFRLLMDPSSSVWMRRLAFAGALVLAPIGEELLFRGIVQSGFHKLFSPRRRSTYHRWVAIALSGSLFGFLHMDTPHFVPALVAFGCFLGFLYEYTGSLLPPIMVHMLFNAKSLIWSALLRG